METPTEPNAAPEEDPDLQITADPEPPFEHPLMRPVSYWVKKLLVCNPFYLVSAALLLYGFYLVSTDANFPGKEIAQLAFNFSALQCYEVLLVATAILLARRRIWYDSNLLIFLENGLILVPFILVSQAALIGRGTVWAMCVIGGTMALIRFATLKRVHLQFNLPSRLLAIGVVLLLVNVALPLIYRTLNDSKVGTKPTDGAAYHFNQYSWFLILPAIVALANALPRPNQTGELLPQRRWIPAGLFALWAAGSIVHLYSLGYIYNFDWETPFIVPPLWILAWTICNRHTNIFRLRGLRPALLVAPAAVTLLAAINSAPHMFLILTGLNILAYAILLLKESSSLTLWHLTVLSLGALGLGFINLHPMRLPLDLNATQCLWAVALAYVCYWICVSRHPKLGIFGAILVWLTALRISERYVEVPHLALQAGIIFLLLHSLLWTDQAHPAKGARIFGCCLWLLHSLILVPLALPHGTLILSVGAVLVLASCIISKFIRSHWPPLILPCVATVVLFTAPGSHLAEPAQSVPIGLWVVAGSFMLFVIGTILALTKSKWHPATATAAAATETNQT